MITKLNHILTHVMPEWPREIFDKNTRAQLLAFSSIFFPTGFGFEVRLNQSMEVDILLRYAKKDGTLNLLAKSQLDGYLPADMIQHPVWTRVLNFAKRCDDRTRSWESDVPFIWLEFDASETTKQIPIPGIFFDASKVTCQGSFLSECTHLSTNKLPAQECIPVIPTGCTIQHIGLMLSRKNTGIRLCITVPTNQLIPFLSDPTIGFPNEKLPYLLHIVNLCRANRCMVHIDIGQETSEKVGIDICFNPLSDFNVIFQELTKIGLCISEKALAMTQWPRAPWKFASQTSEFDHLPVLEENSFAIIQDINHVKLTFLKSGEILGVKAYLWVGVNKIRRFLNSNPR